MSFIDVGSSANDGTGDTLREAFQKLNAARAESVVVVNAGNDLSAARPTGVGAVYWRFSAGIDPGEDGENVVNAEPGDIYYVESS